MRSYTTIPVALVAVASILPALTAPLPVAYLGARAVDDDTVLAHRSAFDDVFARKVGESEDLFARGADEEDLFARGAGEEERLSARYLDDGLEARGLTDEGGYAARQPYYEDGHEHYHNHDYNRDDHYPDHDQDRYYAHYPGHRHGHHGHHYQDEVYHEHPPKYYDESMHDKRRDLQRRCLHWPFNKKKAQGAQSAPTGPSVPSIQIEDGEDGRGEELDAHRQGEQGPSQQGPSQQGPSQQGPSQHGPSKKDGKLHKHRPSHDSIISNTGSTATGHSGRSRASSTASRHSHPHPHHSHHKDLSRGSTALSASMMKRDPLARGLANIQNESD